MDAPSFSFQPGEFVEVEDSSGNIRVARINSVENDTISVNWWAIEAAGPGLDSLLLPRFLLPTYETDIIPKPSISSLVFVFHHNLLSTYRVRYVHGMKIVYATTRILRWFLPCQSISYIIFDCITRLSLELQRVLSNQRNNQFSFSSTSVQCSHLAWKYLVEKLGSVVHQNFKVITFSTMQTNDLSTMKIKAKVPCQVIRLEERHVIMRLIGVLGKSAVVGVRKPLPAMSKKLETNDGAFVTVRGGVQLKDVINLIDVDGNPLPAQQRFRWNASGRCGVDFIFFPTQCSLRINIRYRNFTVQRALEKLRDLGIGSAENNNDELTDEELERMLRS